MDRREKPLPRVGLRGGGCTVRPPRCPWHNPTHVPPKVGTISRLPIDDPY